MVWELLSSLMELQGFTAPMKWTTFALWPNLQEQSCDSCMCYGLAMWTAEWEGDGADQGRHNLFRFNRTTLESLANGKSVHIVEQYHSCLRKCYTEMCILCLRKPTCGPHSLSEGGEVAVKGASAEVVDKREVFADVLGRPAAEEGVQQALVPP